MQSDVLWRQLKTIVKIILKVKLIINIYKKKKILWIITLKLLLLIIIL